MMVVEGRTSMVVGVKRCEGKSQISLLPSNLHSSKYWMDGMCTRACVTNDTRTDSVAKSLHLSSSLLLFECALKLHFACSRTSLL